MQQHQSQNTNPNKNPGTFQRSRKTTIRRKTTIIQPQLQKQTPATIQKKTQKLQNLKSLLKGTPTKPHIPLTETHENLHQFRKFGKNLFNNPQIQELHKVKFSYEKFKKNEKIYQKADKKDNVYYILQGEIQITNKKNEVQIVKSDQIFSDSFDLLREETAKCISDEADVRVLNIFKYRQKVRQMQEDEEIDKKVDSLSSVGIFYGVERYILRTLYNKSESKTYLYNQHVYQKGDKPENIFIIFQGEFQIQDVIELKKQNSFQNKDIENKRKLQEFRTFPIGYLNKNQHFGEEELINKQKKRRYSIKCVSNEGKLLVVKENIFHSLIGKYSDYVSNIQKINQEKNHHQTKQQTQIKQICSNSKYSPFLLNIQAKDIQIPQQNPESQLQNKEKLLNHFQNINQIIQEKHQKITNPQEKQKQEQEYEEKEEEKVIIDVYDKEFSQEKYTSALKNELRHASKEAQQYRTTYLMKQNQIKSENKEAVLSKVKSMLSKPDQNNSAFQSSILKRSPQRCMDFTKKQRKITQWDKWNLVSKPIFTENQALLKHCQEDNPFRYNQKIMSYTAYKSGQKDQKRQNSLEKEKNSTMSQSFIQQKSMDVKGYIRKIAQRSHSEVKNYVKQAQKTDNYKQIQEYKKTSFSPSGINNNKQELSLQENLYQNALENLQKNIHISPSQNDLLHSEQEKPFNCFKNDHSPLYSQQQRLKSIENFNNTTIIYKSHKTPNLSEIQHRNKSTYQTKSAFLDFQPNSTQNLSYSNNFYSTNNAASLQQEENYINDLFQNNTQAFNTQKERKLNKNIEQQFYHTSNVNSTLQSIINNSTQMNRFRVEQKQKEKQYYKKQSQPPHRRLNTSFI